MNSASIECSRLMGLLLILLWALLLSACNPSGPGPDAISRLDKGAELYVLPPNCGDCHGGLVGARREIVGSSGDFAGNTQVVSHHVAGADPTGDQCRVCHEMGAHMYGIPRLRNADTDVAIPYDAADPSTLEPFCLSCHDADGATATFAAGGTALDPFNDGDGTVLGDPPYASAASIADSWAKPYGHGPNGDHAPADQLTCADCHGNNGTMNAHGSNQEVLATQPLVYFDTSGTYTESDFALCFSCHAAYPGVTKEDVFGVLAGGAFDAAYGPPGPNGNSPPYYTAGTVTRFSDHNVTGDPFGLNDPTFWGPAETNLHWFHIEIVGSDHRGTGASSGFKCMNCHDVHGSATPYGALHDALAYTHTFDGTNTYGTIGTALGNLSNPPTNCGFNCHTFQGVTRAWFDPLVE